MVFKKKTSCWSIFLCPFAIKTISKLPESHSSRFSSLLICNTKRFFLSFHSPSQFPLISQDANLNVRKAFCKEKPRTPAQYKKYDVVQSHFSFFLQCNCWSLSYLLFLLFLFTKSNEKQKLMDHHRSKLGS